MREIDSTLRPLEDNDLLPRKYIWPRVDTADFSWDEALSKTERTEKRHQEILADCVSFISSSGLQPKANRNVDLAMAGGDGLTLIEIKSASASNFRSQALKGSMQVIEYAFCFENSVIKVDRKCVLIELPANFERIDYYRKLLSAIGVEMILYDDRSRWPDRANGLLKKV